MQDSYDFTVAICTYNGASRLPDVLECLSAQVGTESINWQIIVVDNNSNDKTAFVVELFQKQLSNNIPIKYLFEKSQGAAFARKKAIQQAQSTLVGFLDDDNLPDRDWVKSAWDFSLRHPNSGAYGSQIQGLFENEVPGEIKKIMPYLAIVERGDNELIYNSKSNLLPPSAGLVVRRKAWLQSVPDQTVLTGRTAKSMVTGEDLEVLSHIRQQGWEIWYNPAMKIKHKIPSWRLKKEYLIPFFRGIGYSRCVTRTVGLKNWQKPIFISAYVLRDTLKLIVLIIKANISLSHNLANRCEFELLIGSLLSPLVIFFYCLDQRD